MLRKLPKACVALCFLAPLSMPASAEAGTVDALQQLAALKEAEACREYVLRGVAPSGGASGSDALQLSASGDKDKEAKGEPCHIPWEYLMKVDGGECRSFCRRYKEWLERWPLYERYPSSHYHLDALGRGTFDVPQKAQDQTLDGLFGFYRDYLRFTITVTGEAFTYTILRGVSDRVSYAYEHLHRSLFWRFENFMILLGLIYAIYGLARGRIAASVGTLITQVVMIALASYFAIYPAKLIDSANALGEFLGTSTMAMLGQADRSAAKSRRFSANAGQRTLAIASDRIWRTFVHEPWASAEFGYPTRGNKKLSGESNEGFDRAVARAAFKVLTTAPALRKKDGDKEKLELKLSALGVGEPAREYPGFQKDQIGTRWRIVLFTSLAGGAYGTILLLVAAQLWLAQNLLVLLFLAAPLFFILSLLPRFGPRVLLNFSLGVAGLIAAKAVYGLLVGLLLLLTSVIVASAYEAGAGGLYISMGTVALLVVIAWKKRDWFLSLLATSHATVGHVVQGAASAGFGEVAPHVGRGARRVRRGASSASRRAYGRLSRSRRSGELTPTGAVPSPGYEAQARPVDSTAREPRSTRPRATSSRRPLNETYSEGSKREASPAGRKSKQEAASREASKRGALSAGATGKAPTDSKRALGQSALADVRAAKRRRRRRAGARANLQGRSLNQAPGQDRKVEVAKRPGSGKVEARLSGEGQRSPKNKERAAREGSGAPARRPRARDVKEAPRDAPKGGRHARDKGQRPKARARKPGPNRPKRQVPKPPKPATGQRKPGGRGEG